MEDDIFNLIAGAIQVSNKTHPRVHLGGPGVTYDDITISSEDCRRYTEAIRDALRRESYVVKKKAAGEKE
jgi:hypothetical protein